MNSTSIFSFLAPVKKSINDTVKEATNTASNYIDVLINAVKLSNALEEKGGKASNEQLSQMEAFFGYGKAAKAFNPEHPRHQELKAAFPSTEAYKTAERGVLHSYFTPTPIVDAMWRTVCRLGLTEGRVIESSCGSGQFIKHAHPSFNGDFYGVELDPTVGIIARHTNPKARIYTNQRFEHAALPNSGQFDLAITNPPWGSYRAQDQQFGNQSIHNYFALRNLTELREGGLMALVVTSWLMDSKSTATRQKIASMANLVAAVRLPNDAFKSETVSLPTDILIFQRTTQPTDNPDWVNTGEHESGARINQFFLNNPQHVLGDVECAEFLQFSSCNINYDGGDFNADLTKALDAQSKQPCYYRTTPSVNIERKTVDVTPTKPVAPFEYFNEGDAIYQRQADTLDEDGLSAPQYIELTFKNHGQEKRARAYIEVKEALKALLEVEKANESKPVQAKHRETLNLLHQGFVRAFGALSRRSNKTVLSGCSLYLRTKALEVDYVAPNKKEGIKESFDPATILKRRVFAPFTPATSAQSYDEALALSLNELAHVSVSRIAELMNATEEDATRTLLDKELTYIDPLSGDLVDAPTYLSGNVREKLAVVDAANDQKFERNYKALKRVLPDDLSAEEITVVMGATWVPEHVYRSFANMMMGDKANFDVMYVAGKWQVKRGGHGFYPAINMTWGTNKREFDQLMENAMNGTPIKVTYTAENKTYVDEEASAEANAKKDEIVNEFEDWVWSCPERRAELISIYNETYNCFVEPDFTPLAKHLTLNGCAMTPYDYQKKAIIRGVLKQNTLLDCCVGSGKTLIFQSMVMMLKRLFGAAERPAIVMPNALVAQFANAMSATYPAANVITLEAELSASAREDVLNTAMVSDFDLLIIPESTFGTLEAPRDMTVKLLNEEIDLLKSAIAECEDRKFTTKQIQKRLEKKEAELKEIMDKPRINSVTWEDLNITTLAVDELQIFKNLPFSTTYSNIRGMGNPNGSKKAWDFFTKARATQQNGGRVIGGTGSSLSNSITEAVAWLRIFAPEIESTGLHKVDSFIRQFSNPVTEYDLAATGRTLKSTTTLKRFQNLSELLAIYRNFAEVLSTENMMQKIPKLDDGRPAIPPIAGGEIENIILPISDAQEKAFEQIVIDAKNINNQENNMLAIIDRARKASLDIRHLDIDAANELNIANAVTEQVVALHKQYKHFNGNQIIFCDRSCPSRHKSGEIKKLNKLHQLAEAGDMEAIKTLDAYGNSIKDILESAFSVYDELEKSLTAAGLKVAVVHDFKTDAQKAKLKSDFNAGRYDVLIGSTMKLGTGWNVNERLVAAHHCDLPLRPGDFEQRNGRILRQQNQAYIDGLLENVHVKTYSTERTLDAWFASVLDRKAKFISQFNNGTLTTREVEVGGENIDFATLSAMVSGDPLMLELVKSQQEVKRLDMLKRSYKRKVYRLEDDKRHYQGLIQKYTNSLAGAYQDQRDAADIDISDVIHNGESLANNPNAMKKVIDNIRAFYSPYKQGDVVKLASIGDKFDVIATKANLGQWEVTIQGAKTHYVGYVDDVTNRTSYKVSGLILKAVESLKSSHTNAINAIHRCAKQVIACDKELSKPFKHDHELQTLKKDIRTLEKQLAESEKQPEEGDIKQAA